MKKALNKYWTKMSIVLAMIFMITACENSFETGGFDVSSPSNVLSFKLNGVSGNIDQATGKITVVMPYGSDITAIKPEVVFVEGATSNPELNSTMNFTNPGKFRVVNGNLYKDYTVTTTVLSPIKSFTINGVAATVNDISKTINMTLPENTDLTALKPVIEVTTGVTI